MTRSHTEAGENLFSSQQQQSLAQRPTPTFAFGQSYRFAALAIVYKVFSFVPGGVALPSGVRCCFAFGRFVLLCPSALLFCLRWLAWPLLQVILRFRFGCLPPLRVVNTSPPPPFGGSPGLLLQVNLYDG